MLLPFVALLIILPFLPHGQSSNTAMIYGFCVFFGWITAIILGMTFKTMPFIIWNKVYHHKVHHGKTPTPKELFNERVYRIMLYCYLSGFIIFIPGLILQQQTI